MSATIGNSIRVTIFGESHGMAVGVVLDGLPAGVCVDKTEIADLLSRRAGGRDGTTSRKECDDPIFVSGVNLLTSVTNGAPLVVLLENKNVKSEDYAQFADVPRPSHSDYAAYAKYGKAHSFAGGGQFSGRLTAPLCVAGAICKTYLKSKGITVGAHLSSVGTVTDEGYDCVSQEIPVNQPQFPVLSEEAGKEMQRLILSCKQEGDSVGGTVECKAIGIPAGLGEPPFDGVENVLARILFGIPAVKGFEIGSGFDGALKNGSQNNDAFRLQNGGISCETNRAGGALGGISSGMPLCFRVAFKPTPSIAKTQKSVDLSAMQEKDISVAGRHDPCIAVRAVPVVEAVTAIAIADLYAMQYGKNER